MQTSEQKETIIALTFAVIVAGLLTFGAMCLYEWYVGELCTNVNELHGCDVRDNYAPAKF